MKRFAAISFTLFILWSCAENENSNRFADPVLVTIADFQDRRLSDSLLQFLHFENPIYRSSASLAFASIQDTAFAPALGNLLLEDPDATVRSNAAFTLGQTGGIAAVNALIPAIHDHDWRVVREALEALGKTVSNRDLEVLLDYNAEDSMAQEGLAWAYYRLGLRNFTDSVMIRRESEFLEQKYSGSTRLAAAHFFSRARLSELSFYAKLINSATKDPLPEVRMAAVSGINKMGAPQALEVLRKIRLTDKDDRVRNNAVRACGKFSLKESESIVFGALRDSSLAVQISASELILRLTKESFSKRIEEEIIACANLRVKANLYGALLSSIPSDKAIQEIIDLYKKSNDYEKAHLLTALGFSQGANEEAAFDFISSAMIKSEIPVIKSTAALALVAINYHNNFFKKKQADFVGIYRQAILDGDPVVTGIIAGALGDSVLGYKMMIHDFNFLYEAKKKLHLPKDIESLQPLVDAIAYFENKEKPARLKNLFNHPIDWKLIKSIPKDQHVLIRTAKGDIIMRLFVEETPGAVGNFVGLVSTGYFDGRYFHRVVPNFVIQTGCNRGDGFGSEDYSIRSEFLKQRYKTGAVGMASAGKDTEGTQWFITHSPTPHLDGRYTLFAKVEKGMEIVDRIEVGDVIVSVSLIKN